MTDKCYALTVYLSEDMREDDAEPIAAAIRMVKGVMEVKPITSTPESDYAQIKARRELIYAFKEVLTY